jgi:hypothetical protein
MVAKKVDEPMCPFAVLKSLFWRQYPHLEDAKESLLNTFGPKLVTRIKEDVGYWLKEQLIVWVAFIGNLNVPRGRCGLSSTDRWSRVPKPQH